MKKNEVLRFLAREIGEDGEGIFDSILDKNGISDIEAVDKPRLRMVAKDLRDALPAVSITKRNVLYAEILKILGIETLDTGKDTLSNAKVKQHMEDEHVRLESFVKDINQSLTKYEAIFNLFWRRAGEAEMCGVGHEDVMKITNKALTGIKKDLEKSRETIMKEYSLLDEEHRSKFDSKYHFKSPLFVSPAKDRSDEVNSRNRDMVKAIVDRFWKDIDESYRNFEDIFLDSMKKEIEFKKKGLDDSELVTATQRKMIRLWEELEASYKKFIKEMDEVKERIGENWSNLLLSQ